MKIINTFPTFYGKEATPKEMQLIVYSVKAFLTKQNERAILIKYNLN